MGKISCIRATPLALDAVITLAPETDAARQALMAECSLSTVTRLVSTSPSATNSENFMGMSVDGVMGYAATTSGLICLMASATAQFPEVISFFGILFTSFRSAVLLLDKF